MTGPKLSICIPTFNRRETLTATLRSIEIQPEFLETDDVEIVISDNCSTDHTFEVGEAYAARYPTRVVYHRHHRPTARGEHNFHHALSLGNGTLLKLHNDTLRVRTGALADVLEVIDHTAAARPLLFMTNGNNHRPEWQLAELCRNLDEFVDKASYFTTWIGGLCLWRDDLAASRRFLNDTSRLTQVSIVTEMVAAGRQAVVLYPSYFESVPDGRAGYNLTEVFGATYLGILKEHVRRKRLSPAAFAREKQRLLFGHLLPYYLDPATTFDKRGFFEHLAEYRDDAYFHDAIAEHLPYIRQNCGLSDASGPDVDPGQVERMQLT